MTTATRELYGGLNARYSWDPEAGLSNLTLMDGEGGAIQLVGDNALRLEHFVHVLLADLNANTDQGRRGHHHPESFGLVLNRVSGAERFATADADLADFGVPFLEWDARSSRWELRLSHMPRSSCRMSAPWNEREQIAALVDLMRESSALAVEAALARPQAVAADREEWERLRQADLARTTLHGARVNVAAAKRALLAAGATRNGWRDSRFTLAPIQLFPGESRFAQAVLVGIPRNHSRNTRTMADAAMATLNYRMLLEIPSTSFRDQNITVWSTIEPASVAPYEDGLRHLVRQTASGAYWGKML